MQRRIVVSYPDVSGQLIGPIFKDQALLERVNVWIRVLTYFRNSSAASNIPSIGAGSLSVTHLVIFRN